MGYYLPNYLLVLFPSFVQHNTIKPSDIFSSEFNINDVPSGARDVLTKGITREEISSFSGTKITLKGQHLAPGVKPGPNQKPLTLFIQGPNKQSLDCKYDKLKD